MVGRNQIKIHIILSLKTSVNIHPFGTYSTKSAPNVCDPANQWDVSDENSSKRLRPCQPMGHLRRNRLQTSETLPADGTPSTVWAGAGRKLLRAGVSTPGHGQGEGPDGYKSSLCGDAVDAGRGRSERRERSPACCWHPAGETSVTLPTNGTSATKSAENV